MAKKDNTYSFLGLGMFCMVFGVVFILIYNGNIGDADRKASWLESTATVNAPMVIDEYLDRTRDENDDNYDYRVKFEFYITYETESGQQSFLSTFERTGENSRHEIPDSAYDFYADGETASITYDPQNPQEYVFGEKDAVIAGLQDKVPLYAGYIGCGLGGLFLLIFVLKLIRARGEKEPERTVERSTL